MNVFEIYAKLGLDTSAYDKALDDAMQRAKSASGDFDGLGTSTTKSSGAMSKFGSVLKTGVSGALKVATAAIGAATTAVVGLGTYSTRVGMEFEAQMSKVQAISGATGDELKALESKAEEMGAITKFSATEAGQAYEYMAMAGWKTGDMLGGIEGIMNLAAASGESLAATSDIVTDALTAFGLAAEDSGHFADVLARASSSSNTNVGMMGETFKYVAPVAGAMGFAIEDTAVAIGLMANAGIKAGQAGTSLRAIMSNLVKRAEEDSAKWENLGVSISNTDGTMRDLNDIIIDLRSSFDGMSEEQKVANASWLAGQEAMSGLLAIVNASDEDFATLTAAIANADGAAKDMATTMQDNLAGALEELGGSAETFGLAMYKGIAESLKNVVIYATDSLNQLTEAYRTGGVEGLTDAAGKILSSMITKLTSGAPQILTVGVNLLISLLDGLLSKANIKKLTDGASTIIKTLVSGALSLLKKTFDVGWEVLLSIIDGIIEALPQLLDTAVDLVLHIVTEITKPESLHRIIMAALELVKTLANGLIDAIPELITATVKIAYSLYQYLTSPEVLLDLLSAGFKMIAEVALGITKANIEITTAISDTIRNIFTKFNNTDWRSLGRDLVDDFLTGLKNGWRSITNWFDDAIGDLSETVSNLWDSITGAKKEANNVSKNPSPIRSSSSYADTYNPTFNVQLTLDGKTAAEALVNPIDELRRQRGY